MVKKGYILSETDRSILSQTVAKVNGSPLTPSKLNRRHRDQPAGGSSEYSGFFKVIDASEEESGTVKLKIKVVDGAAEDSENCGTAWINNKRLQIKAVEKSVTGSGFVYLKASLSETGVVTEETTEIVIMSSPPTLWEDMSYTLIARLFVTGESMRIVQESHGEIKAVIWGECQ